MGYPGRDDLKTVGCVTLKLRKVWPKNIDLWVVDFRVVVGTLGVSPRKSVQNRNAIG